MKKNADLEFSPFLPYLRLVGRFPLHLAAAFMAALLAEFLFTIQPAFLRTFIDQAQAGAPRRVLLVFPAFMVGAAVLAYAFDFISVTIRYLLEARLARLLKEVYVEFCAKDRAEVVQFSLWTGLSQLSRLALSLSVDLWLALARIALVLGFLSLEHWGFGLAAMSAMLLGGIVNWTTTRRIGRLSKSKEIASGKLVAGAQSAPRRAKRRLARLYSLDFSEYGLRSANFAASFLLFRILPLSVVAWYVWGSGLSLGSVTSAFLYFSMLQGPYGDLARLIQDAMVAATESELFRKDLEEGLACHQALSMAGGGLVWTTSGAALGSPLSRAATEPDCRIFFDDFPAASEREVLLKKAVFLDILRRRSSKESGAILVRSADEVTWQFAHFRLKAGSLKTILFGLGPEGAKPYIKNGISA